MRGSWLHNLILVKIPRIRNNQCGEKQNILGSITAECVILFFSPQIHGQALFSAPHLLSWAEFAFFPQPSIGPHCKYPKTMASNPYLPPFKGFIREDAVLPGHQRVDGLIEVLGEPLVVLRLRHAPLAGARAFGEQVVGQAEGVLEEVERGVPESVTEQERCEGNNAKQHGQSPEPSPLGQRHGVAVRISWPGALGGRWARIAS